jgi:hypothetical protein
VRLLQVEDDFPEQRHLSGSATVTTLFGCVMYEPWLTAVLCGPIWACGGWGGENYSVVYMSKEYYVAGVRCICDVM